MKRALKAFGDFWFDFLVGDAPEFLFVTAAVVLLAFVLHAHRDFAMVLLPLITLGAVAVSAHRVRRR